MRPVVVGKSTVSKELVNRKDKCAMIEEDDIYHLVTGENVI